MASGNVARIIRAPGRLVVGPTDLSAAYPYGGTEVGKTNVCVLQPQGSVYRVEYEALGEIGDILEADVRYVFACFLRGWDDDAVSLLMSGRYVAGSTTQHATLQEPGPNGLAYDSGGGAWTGSRVPGSSALDRAVVLLYVPDDLIHVPALLVYRGVCEWSDGAQVAFQRREELGIPLTVDCVRDTNDNIVRIGRLADLSLT